MDKAISLSQLRKDLFNLFATMRDDGTMIHVYHRRKIYRLQIEDTGGKITIPYRRKKPKLGPLPTAMVHTAPCKECGSLLINGVCANPNCPVGNLARVQS